MRPTRSPVGSRRDDDKPLLPRPTRRPTRSERVLRTTPWPHRLPGTALATIVRQRDLVPRDWRREFSPWLIARVWIRSDPPRRRRRARSCRKPEAWLCPPARRLIREASTSAVEIV